ncbi:MAG TPA: ABC transporter permease [Cyclobacteriaceae bacterium]|nr:ABC transporter permease [Cyclobacteriaceae bacterium]
MLINYIKTALRSLIRHRFFSAINIFGLAVAMSIGMAIIMLVADQVSYDYYNTKRNRIYRVTTAEVNEKGIEQDHQRNSASTMALRNELMDKYTGIEKVIRFKRGFGNNWLEFEGQDVNIPLAGFFADPEVFDFFEYEFQYGDPSTALKEPYTVVLTRKAANKLFKEENPLGLTVKVGDLGTYTVTGVLKETPNKSHVVFEALASMATVNSLNSADENNKEKDRNDELENWTNFWNGWTYILLEPGITTDEIQSHLDKIYEDHIATITDPDTYKMKFHLQALSDITPGPMMNNSIGPVLPWIFVYFLGGLALIILLTSCFNFTNLSIARSLTRAREIGVRKVTGAARWQIFVQFLSESIVVSLFALAIASLILFFLKPFILQLNFARIFRWDLESNMVVYVIFLMFAATVGILAGFFPAIVLSGFQPVKVLKSVNNMKVFSRIGLRKVLLVSQFTLSLFFILSVIIMYNQLHLFLSKDHGFNMKNNIMIRLNRTAPGPLKNELLKYNNIQTVTAASHVPAAGTSMGNGFKKSQDEKEWTNLGRFTVDEDYLKNMQLDLIAGKFFRAEAGVANKNSIVINEAAVKALQFSSPEAAIGEELIPEYDTIRKTVIGVVKDYNHRDLTRTISPLGLVYNPDQISILQVSYTGNYQSAVKVIEKAWAAVNPGLKVDYKEIESEIKQFYEIVFGDLVKLLSVTAFLAILISCLGLLGMATYVTESRVKEISIRKILGSSGRELVMLLSKGFLAVLALAIAIGVPATYFINNLWLEQIAYHTSMDLPVIGLGVLILLAFGMVTVGSQTIRATFVNPVDNLKSE